MVTEFKFLNSNPDKRKPKHGRRIQAQESQKLGKSPTSRWSVVMKRMEKNTGGSMSFEVSLLGSTRYCRNGL